MKNNELIPHLFRKEYSRLVSVLVKVFGFEEMETAEDIAGETFLSAAETWPCRGIPENPSAWLYAAAKNKARNYLVRQNIFRDKIMKKMAEGEKAFEPAFEFSEDVIKDSQLRMLFAVCHPSVSAESRICLALKVLCGFSTDEIADAFLTNRETVHKRLQRGKEKLRSEKIEMIIPENSDLAERMESVLRTLYLFFSEGYYSQSHSSNIREDLCLEAMDLNAMLLENLLTSTHSANALMSLMFFQASRLKARRSGNGETVLYEEQDRNLWDNGFIEKGFYYLQQASKWETASKYYIEACIAYWHTVKDEPEDKWMNILKLYDILAEIDPSPSVSLNRIYALSKVKGNQAALSEAERLDFPDSHFYFILLAELYRGTDLRKSVHCLGKAMEICRTDSEKMLILKKMKILENSVSVK
ncbi:MAG TPA: sigma-70 family RNA polymerase sigma factor [Leptospiraceae bacterium]|nr:sigma-70 family RNA polymerase sigma factor [Leptospiraceae bacterium]